MARSWLLLVASGLLQVGWLVSLRQMHGFSRAVPVLFYLLCGAGSAWCLSQSLGSIPMGTAYAAWTGISVAATFLVDGSALRAGGLARVACVLLILAGTAGLKLAEPERDPRPPRAVAPQGRAFAAPGT